MHGADPGRLSASHFGVVVQFTVRVVTLNTMKRTCCDQVIVCVGVIIRQTQLRFAALFEWFLACYLPFIPVCLATIEYWNHLIHSELSSETVHRRW